MAFTCYGRCLLPIPADHYTMEVNKEGKGVQRILQTVRNHKELNTGEGGQAILQIVRNHEELNITKLTSHSLPELQVPGLALL